MLLGVATLLCAEVIHGTVAGRIVDALTGNPVSGAVVTDGKWGGTLTDSQGRFVLSGLAGNGIDVIVQHPAYVVFAQAGVPLGSRIEIKLQPSSIEAEPVEIVETREEDLRPMLLRQDPFYFSPEFRSRHRGGDLKGLYRVCVGKDGNVSMVAALNPAGLADSIVKEGIAKGWAYKPLPKAACFLWRVTLHFGSSRGMRSSPAPEGQYIPPGPPFVPK
jgi:hypothetical protein